jgi:hypothetical protein
VHRPQAGGGHAGVRQLPEGGCCCSKCKWKLSLSHASSQARQAHVMLCPELRAVLLSCCLPTSAVAPPAEAASEEARGEAFASRSSSLRASTLSVLGTLLAAALFRGRGNSGPCPAREEGKPAFEGADGRHPLQASATPTWLPICHAVQPNNGRFFWSCGKFSMTGGGAQCDFMKWAEEVAEPPPPPPAAAGGTKSGRAGWR